MPITQEQANEYIMATILRIADKAAVESIVCWVAGGQMNLTVEGSPWAVDLFRKEMRAFAPDWVNLSIASFVRAP